MNTNSFFSLIDGSMRMIGIFDGHGEYGYLVSSAAMSILLDYLRNRNDVFRSNYILKAEADEILFEIKKAFKYTQTVLK